jgi:hypothetical protein
MSRAVLQVMRTTSLCLPSSSCIARSLIPPYRFSHVSLGRFSPITKLRGRPSCKLSRSSPTGRKISRHATFSCRTFERVHRSLLRRDSRLPEQVLQSNGALALLRPLLIDTVPSIQVGARERNAAVRVLVRTQCTPAISSHSSNLLRSPSAGWPTTRRRSQRQSVGVKSCLSL